MKRGIAARLTKLEARQPRKGRQHVLLVAGEYDPNAEFRKRGIVLGADDGVMWIELVGVQPPDRPPWRRNEDQPRCASVTA